MGVSKTSDHIKIKIKVPNPSQEPPESSKAPNEDLKDMDNLLHLQNQDREPKFRPWTYQRPVIISKSRSRCQTPIRNIKHPEAPNEDIKDMNVLCTFKIKIESQNSEHGCIKDQ